MWIATPFGFLFKMEGVCNSLTIGNYVSFTFIFKVCTKSVVKLLIYEVVHWTTGSKNFNRNSNSSSSITHQNQNNHDMSCFLNKLTLHSSQIIFLILLIPKSFELCSDIHRLTCKILIRFVKESYPNCIVNPFSTGILWKIGITKKAKHPTLNASISKTKTNSE